MNKGDWLRLAAIVLLAVLGQVLGLAIVMFFK